MTSISALFSPRLGTIKTVIRDPKFIPWALLVVFSAVYFSSTVGISNSQDGPDYALTRAIVERRTTDIGAYPQWINPDYAQVDGRVYAMRSPGLSLLGAPFYILALGFHRLATAPYNWQHQGLTSDSPTEALSMFYPALCGALVIVLFYLICFTLTQSRTASLIAAVSLGLGTLLWRYSISYQRMPLYILLLTLLFYLAITFRPTAVRPYKLLLIGVLLGYTVVTESTAIFIVPIYLGWFLVSIATAPAPLALRRRAMGIVVVGMGGGLSVLAAYNLISFHHLFINLYESRAAYRWETYGNLFSTPLWPSIALNLFSHGPIPYDALSPVLRNNPAIFVQQSANWALKDNYQGLFIQSPYFFGAVAGLYFFFRERRRQAVLGLAIAAVVLIAMSKLVCFFSANLFDGRYFTPMLPFLTIGLAYLWRNILALRNRALKVVLGLFAALLCGMSIYKGWEATLTNYGPHVTGDHRFLLDIPPTNWLSENDWFHHATLLWINTFPNIYNLWILICYAGVGLFFYLLYEEIRSWIVPAAPKPEVARAPAAASLQRDEPAGVSHAFAEGRSGSATTSGPGVDG